MTLSFLEIIIVIGVSLTFVVFPRHSKCSYVIDSHIQKNYTDYCAKTEYCPEGTHVMCMYKHYFKFHGRCGSMRELGVNATLATWLMNVSNAIRRKIALGTEKVNGKPLPRGYGMFKLSWDPELATFAQTLADECLLQHDLCRGSKRFPHPGQIVGVCRFSYPDWQPIIGGTLTTSKRLTFVKIKYGLKQILMSWYNQKKYATEDMIQRYPAEAAAPRPTARPYLDIISGKSTHMGCGISGYSQFAHYDYNASLIYNHLQLVCNYSHRPLNGTPVYTTSPPTQAGYTVKCGCPEGYDEDPDCLCVANGQIPAAPPKPTPKFCSDNNCTPAVVLLPIFNVEDAPPEKLIPPGFLNQTRRIEQSFEIFDDHVINGEPESLNEFNELLQKTGATNIRSPYNTRHAGIQRRTYGASKPTQLRLGKSYSKIKLPAQKHIATQSIFSKSARFQLPTKTNSNRKEIIKDVAPRRDFANVQKLLQTYLNKKRNSIGNIFKGNENTYNGKPKLNEIFNHKTDNILNTNKIGNTNFNKQKHYEANMTNNIKESYVKSSNDEADKKFMVLLDNLEQEVKHTDLDATEKEIFDTKIRKIYSAVVDKPQDQQFEPTPYKSPNKEVLANLINYENAADNEFIDEKTLNKRIHKSATYDGFEERTQDSIRNKNKNHRNIIKTVYDVEDNFKEIPNNRNERRLQEMRKKNNIIGNSKYYDMRIKDFNPKIDMNEDPLSYERKKYYQEKLDNLERKLQSIKVSRHHNVHPPRQIRPVLPTYQSQMEIRPSKASTQMDTFYVPDRARFIHGF